MKVNRVRLTNFGVIESIDVELQPGLIGLLGPMGSGKSTFVNAMYAGLTNDFGRVEGGKEGAVRQQRPESARSELVIDAEHNDVPFCIQRLLAPATKSKLTLGGQQFVKSNEIQQQIDQLLGVDRSILDNYVFVEQWGVRQLFQQSGAERAKTLAKLCGTTWAETCWEVINRRLIADETLAASQDIDLDAIRARVAAAQQKVDEAQIKVDGLIEDSTDHVKDKTAAAGRIAMLQSAVALQRRIATITGMTESQRLAAEDAATRATQHEQFLVELRARNEPEIVSLERRVTGVAEYEAKAIRWREFVRTKDYIPGFERKLAEIVLPAAPALPAVEELEQKYQALLHESAPQSILASQLRGLADVATCPTCGQEIADVQEQLRQADAYLESVRPQLQDLEKAIGEWKAYRQAYAAAEKAQASVQSSLASVKATLEAYADVVDPGEPPVDTAAVLRAAVASLKRELGKAADDQSSLAQAKAASAAGYQAARDQSASLEKEYADLGLAEDLDFTKEIADQQQIIEEIEATRRAQAEARAYLTACRETLTERQSEFEAAQAASGTRQASKRWVSALKVAKGVLHRDGLPSLVHKQALREMESGVNELLERFESPFQVRASDDLSYTAYFRNGTVMPAKGLSGGQQVVLSIAFRWTLNSLFAGQIGMMVLDEPTAGLDERHIDLVEQTFTGLAEEAIAKHFQVLVITHDLRLERAFHQVIRLDRAVD